MTGTYLLGIVLIILVISLLIAFRKSIFRVVFLKDSIKGRVNEDLPKLQPGDIGKTLSSLRPYGKAEFENGVFEVRTSGNFLDENIPVRVVRIYDSQIIVEPIK